MEFTHQKTYATHSQSFNNTFREPIYSTNTRFKNELTNMMRIFNIYWWRLMNFRIRMRRWMNYYGKKLNLDKRSHHNKWTILYLFIYRWFFPFACIVLCPLDIDWYMTLLFVKLTGIICGMLNETQLTLFATKWYLWMWYFYQNPRTI